MQIFVGLFLLQEQLALDTLTMRLFQVSIKSFIQEDYMSFKQLRSLSNRVEAILGVEIVSWCSQMYLFVIVAQID